MSRNRYKNFNEVKATKGGNWLLPGNYLLQVQRCLESTSDANGKEFFIAEFVVLESDNEKIKSESEVSWVVNYEGQFPKLALQNIKGFAEAAFASLAVANGDQFVDDVGQEHMDAVLGEENCLAGVYVTAKAFDKATRDGGTFTRINWSCPSPSKLVELVAA